MATTGPNNIKILMPDYELLKKVRNATEDNIPLSFSKNLHLNAKNKKSGMTPLLYAIFNEHNETAKKLIYFGADVNEVDNYEKTALMYASDNCNLDMIRLLINKGADVEAKSGKLTAYLIASAKFENTNDTNNKVMKDKCNEVLALFENALKNKNGGRRLKRRTTKKNRRLAKSKRYTRAKQ
jgi:ankyrin repeat protein